MMRPGKLFVFIFLLAAILLLTGFNGGNDQEDQKKTALMFGEVNTFRTAGGRCGNESMPPVAALVWNETLEKAARLHARDMYSHRYFEHIDREGRAPIQRAAMLGYKGTVVGENIGRGTSSVQKVLQGWKNSESHCKNMMDGHYSEMGAAHYRGYWVQEFGGNVAFDKEAVTEGLGGTGQIMMEGWFFLGKLAVVLIVALAFVVFHQSIIRD